MRCFQRIKIWFIITFKKNDYKHKDEYEFNPYKSIVDEYEPQLNKKSFINI